MIPYVKILNFTATFPDVMLLMLFIRGLTLFVVWDGLLFCFCYFFCWGCFGDIHDKITQAVLALVVRLIKYDIKYDPLRIDNA